MKGEWWRYFCPELKFKCNEFIFRINQRGGIGGEYAVGVSQREKTDSGGFVVCREPAVGGFEPQPDSGCEGGNGRQLVAAFVAPVSDVVICRHCGGRGVV